MAMVNPFDVFSVTEIAAAINRVPNNYGRINQLGLMPVRGTTSRTVAVEERNGSLALIPTERAGDSGSGRGPGNVGSTGKRNLRTFRVPNLTYDEFVGPEEVQGVRAFGGSEQQNIASLLNEKLETARAKHDITLEHLRMGALKGIIVDADGSTLYDLYSEFGITAKEVDFVLGTGTTDIKAKCHAVKRHIEDNLLGETMTTVRVLVSPEFFDAFTNHQKVQKAFENWQAAQDRLGGDMRNGFTFGGLIFEEYRGVSSSPDGTKRRFIADGEGHAFPEGTQQTFRTHVAPADFNEAVGQMGQIYYAKTMPAKFDRGWDVHTQSNPLPLCHRPGVLVKVFSSN